MFFHNMGPLVETVLSMEKTVGYLWFYLKKVEINVKSFFLEIVSGTLYSCYYLTIIQQS